MYFSFWGLDSFNSNTQMISCRLQSDFFSMLKLQFDLWKSKKPPQTEYGGDKGRVQRAEYGELLGVGFSSGSVVFPGRSVEAHTFANLSLQRVREQRHLGV
uniref:Uncharacterized protein n=1 Tax=Knipowitschia caucasica TaxID=637954 RepID=A0AAV2JH62_KNICA